MYKVGIIQDPIYLDHLTPRGHFESPERLKAISEMLKNSGLENKTKKLQARPASEEEIRLVHSSQLYLQVQNSQSYQSYHFDADTFASPQSFMAAKFAVGGLLVAVDELIEGKIEEAFCFPRPPGHHAEAQASMGFCLFNNIAVAAEYALKKRQLKKILIFDFDVHHGNGTQHIFEDRADVFYISIHQYPFYPGTGSASEIGKNNGEGYTLNIPLPSACGDEIYLNYIKEKIEVEVMNYKPDFIMISAGFDAHQRDPLGGMRVSKNGFRSIAEAIARMKIKCGHIPLLYALEGGYHLQALSESVKEVLEVMLK